MIDYDCIFCDIVDGRATSSKVYEDALCLAFMDIQPINTGQVLIIPKVHASSLSDLDDSTAGHMMKIAQNVSMALKKTDISCEGINLFLADGEAAMQEVFHVHLHVVPRFRVDGFGFKYGENNFVFRDRKDLDSAANKIRVALST